MYVDEVGNADLGSSDDPNHRFLSLTGVIIDRAHVRSTVYPQLEALKTAYFDSHPDEPVILHRKELVNGRGAFVRLRNPVVRAAFDEELLALMRAWDYTVISACLDKLAHRERHSVWRSNPYHSCLAVLLEHYMHFLDRRRGRGDVLAESRGGKEDKRLKESFAGLVEEHSAIASAELAAGALTSEHLKVKPKSANVAGLQLADIIAHPSRNEILSEHSRDVTIAPFAARVIAVLQAKYDRRGDRVFGKRML